MVALATAWGPRHGGINAFNVECLRPLGTAPRCACRLARVASAATADDHADALLAEYEDVLSRSDLFVSAVLSAKERQELFDGYLNRCRWVEVFYAWRPSLPDEADNHLIELGVAARADAIITRNLRDVSRGELKFPALRVITPEQCLEVFPCQP